MEARRAVLDDVIREWEVIEDGSHPAPRPPTVAEIASFRARTNLCTGLGAAEVANHLNLYRMVRHEYFAAVADGSPAELLAVWRGIAAEYQEAQYQACAAAPVPVAADVDLAAIVRLAVETHRTQDPPIGRSPA